MITSSSTFRVHSIRAPRREIGKCLRELNSSNNAAIRIIAKDCMEVREYTVGSYTVKTILSHMESMGENFIIEGIK